jgi:predicted DNA-binding transcriptional regulator AlpA
MDTKDAYSIIEFCQRHGLSRSGFYNAVKAGEGPVLMKIGNRTLISREAAERWRRDREVKSTTEAA